MQVGEKIKKLRTAKLMTQSELVGGEITRNMLSRIENGAAQPSMATIKYIAKRLNVSPGFLLAEEDDEILYFKSAEIGNIKKAYSNKDYGLCREMCINSEWRDDELMLILAESTLHVAIDVFARGNLHRASELFDEAIECCAQTVYNTDTIMALAQSYFRYMSYISPTLDSNSSDVGDASRLPFLNDEFFIYSSLFLSGERQGYKMTPHGEDKFFLLERGSSYEMHLRAKILMEESKYSEGYAILYELLFNDSYEIPEPMLYFIFGDLEVCCKETEDFKGAYDFSRSKIDLMQKLLS